MNAENALSLLTLAQDFSRARRGQLSALSAAVNRLDCVGASRDCRTYTALAVYLGHLGARVENLIASEIDAAMRQIDGLKNFPDETQWEYRSATSLGLAAAMNRAGTVQAKIIELGQSALQKASLVLMAQAKDTFLPISSRTRLNHRGRADYIETILLDLDSRLVRRMADASEMALQLSGNYLQRALQADGESNQTISAICSVSFDLALANILAALCAFAREGVNPGIFADDPAGAVRKAEINDARLLAAGQVSALITDLIKADNPWVAVNLN